MREHVFNLKPSKWFVAQFLLIWIVSLFLPLFFSIPLWVKGCSLLFTLIYGGYLAWNKVLLRSNASIRTIKLLPTNEWLIKTGNYTHTAKLRGDSIVSAKVIILRFQLTSWRTLSTVILKDTLLYDEYRKLTIMLNLEKKEASNS